MAQRRPPSPASAEGSLPAREQATESEEHERTGVEPRSRLLMILREAEVIARNLKESGTRR